MHSISIALPALAADRLRELARRERRSPRQQAAVLVLAGLEREGWASAPGDAPPPAARPVETTPADEAEA